MVSLFGQLTALTESRERNEKEFRFDDEEILISKNESVSGKNYLLQVDHLVGCGRVDVTENGLA